MNHLARPGAPEVMESEFPMSLPRQVLQGILARGALVLLRVYLGVAFVVAALAKRQQDFTAFFPALVTWAELLVGVLLILGLLTRLSAAVAVVLALNYMFAKGAWFWTPSSNDAAVAAIALALLIGAAGRTFGLDAFLARRWPRSPFW
jgi:uncharacterized membrane protein YphA (DoxX/SURF4 family)